MGRIAREWTEDEMARLRELVKTHTYSECAKLLGRSNGSTAGKIRQIRMRNGEKPLKDNKTWMEEDDRRLTELSLTMSNGEIGRVMGKSARAISNRINRLKTFGKWNGRQDVHRKTRYHGCDRNCTSCPYPDCFAPPQICTIDLRVDDYIENRKNANHPRRGGDE